MTLVGRYDASFEGVSGSLFVYGESPVTSLKLNRWHGNIDAGFWLLHRLVRLLATGDDTPYLLDETANDPFLLEEQATPDMTVKVNPGFLFGPGYLVGLSAGISLPTVGTFTAPVANPRIDSVGVRETGEWVVASGTEAASPAAPSLDADTVRLADIYLRVGSNSIRDTDDGTNAYLIDQRPDRLRPFGHRHTGPESPTESPDGTRTQFSTSDRFVSGSLRVYVNGLQQMPTTHYTEDSDHRGYTFVTAPSAGFLVHHEYQPE